jgi:hypothetical protein
MARKTIGSTQLLLSSGLAFLLGGLLWAPSTGMATPASDVPACAYRASMALEGRPSPLDSTQVALAGGTVKICYGSPSLRGRAMIGGEAVPFGALWRFGANEPTTLHTTVALNLGSIRLSPGSYSLYALPEAGHWEIFASTNVDRWGIPITPEVRAAEVGSTHAMPTILSAPVEAMELVLEAESATRAVLHFRWETTALRLPLVAAGG